MSATSPEGAVWVRDFTPGYLDSPESDTLPLGATPDAKNAFLYKVDLNRRRATMGRRQGCRMVLPTAVVAETAWDGLFEWRSGGSPTLLGIINGDLYSIDPVLATSTLVGTGWTAGEMAHLFHYRNDAIIFDGTFMRRWDGTTLYALGSGAPGTLTNMTAGAGSVTGTFEAVYTWYNASRDRHSSVSDATATLALAGQGRTHTKPGSAAPAWATHWGIWVRRTDTSELNYFWVANVAVATGTHVESVSDTVRQRGDIAALATSHDAPPGAFQVLAEHKGYPIGILAQSDSYHVGALGDVESWHPKHKYPVSRATGDHLCWAKKYGEEFLLGTDHASWRLEGDAPPFKPLSVHPRYGNVSQKACLEVNGRFYGWDRLHGPYVTDLVSWRPLGRHRIDNLLDTVNRSALSAIRAIHVEKLGLIGWLVATGTSTRRRTILWYHYDLDCWLPPQTGMEYADLSEFTDATGALGIYMADYWGRLYELFSGAREGVPATSPTDNVREAAVVSATPNTVTVDVGSGALYTAGSGLAGLPVAVVNGGGTVWQWRIIKSNTSSVITIDTVNGPPWETTPDDTYRVVIGGIEWYWWTPWVDFGIPHKVKVLRHLYVQARSASQDHQLQVRARFNNDDGAVSAASFAFDVAVTAGIWGVSMWGSALWGETQKQLRKHTLSRSPLTVQFRFSNYLPDQDLKVPLYGLTADRLPGMEAPSS